MYRNKWRWKEVGVGEEEPTKNCTAVVVAFEMGRGLISIVVRESQGITLVRLSRNRVRFSYELYPGEILVVNFYRTCEPQFELTVYR